MMEHEPKHEDVRFEHSDLNAGHTFLTGIGVLVGTWITIGIIFFYFTGLAHHRAAVSPPTLPIAEHGQPLPPEPRLQANPHADLKAYTERETWELTHYHWLDRQKGVVAIPIERAMALVAARGIPPQKWNGPANVAPPEEGTRLTGFEGKVEPEPR